ncbi:diguanylate cyclase [Maridesulfovibrio sp.]|uniref:GGDEF domain-containing response regulator n=1 Tax=Maridesulfovibrio sp. TaxID=2795000 RepID=UPI0029F56B44|nr:diguanylate cyclase [Maridesulfovibrio sp.]
MKKKINKCLTHPNKVLIVEDSLTFSGILKRSVSEKLDLESEVFRCYADAKDYLENSQCEFFSALLDLNLPDAPDGEIVDLVAKQIPSIVFTGEVSDDLRDRMWAKRIVDYVPKDNLGNIDHVIGLVNRLQKNISTNVLIVDASATNRELCRNLLEVWHINIFEAKDGFEALKIINNGNDKISLVIVDHDLPGMDGPTLVKELRRNFSKAHLPIIGLSGVGGATISAYFLKSGANDYIHKPFLTEEFYCRVTQNIENSEYISMIKHLSDHDSLTSLYNRRSLFQYGEKIFAQQRRLGTDMAVAMVDIDFLKECNETYGHSAGDEVVKNVAALLTEKFSKRDFVCRYSGGEFCILCSDIELDDVVDFFEQIRSEIEMHAIYVGTKEVSITVSIGLCSKQLGSLTEMIAVADEQLYAAKKGGRNMICYSGM